MHACVFVQAVERKKSAANSLSSKIDCSGAKFIVEVQVSARCMAGIFSFTHGQPTRSTTKLLVNRKCAPCTDISC